MYEGSVRKYSQIIQDSGDPGYVNRLLIATPTTGLVRIEWVAARYGQLVPANWSVASMNQYLSGYIPVHYQVDDAQNLIVKQAIEGEFEWLLLLEHDKVLPADALIHFTQWIRSERAPVVSGLYYTRSEPSQPLVFRGRGNSVYTNWEMGDIVPCDGVPTGCLLIDVRLLKAMWEESPEYLVGNRLTRRVFDPPPHVRARPDTQGSNVISGASALSWCDRIINERFLEKAGWPIFQECEFPFLVDTNILCGHIEQDGRMYPHDLEQLRNELKEKHTDEGGQHYTVVHVERTSVHYTYRVHIDSSGGPWLPAGTYDATIHGKKRVSGSLVLTDYLVTDEGILFVGLFTIQSPE